MAFKIVTIGFEQAGMLLGQLELVMSNVNRTDLKTMIEIGESDVKQHFKDQGAGWKPRKASTMRRIAFNSKASQPRKDIATTGKKLLMNQLTLMNGTKGRITNAPYGFAINNNVEYAQKQNFEREFMWFSLSATDRMVAVPFARIEKVASRKY